jgi:hypothetical protein
MAVVKGGEISGRIVAASRTARQTRPRPARAAVKAKRKPSAVPHRPTSAASSRLLAKARRCCGARMMETTWATVNRPPSSANVLASSAPSG